MPEREVAVHAELKGRHGRVTDDQPPGRDCRDARAGRSAGRDRSSCGATPTLLRPLAEYEAAIGGGF